jgi:hypothetical protein
MSRRVVRRQRWWAERTAGLTGPRRAEVSWDAARAAVHQAPRGRRDEAWQWLAEALDDIRDQIAGMTDGNRSQIHTGLPDGAQRASTRAGATRARGRNEV